MAGGYPSLKPHYGKPWTEWLDQVERKLPTMLLNEKVEKIQPSVTLLPRKDILLYGSCPKMDVRVLCQCERCGKLLMPVSYVSHMKEKHGPDQVHQPASSLPAGASLLKKKYPHSKSKKKINPPPVPPPPLFQPYEAPVPASPIQAPAAISAAATATTTSAAAVPATTTVPTVVQASENKPATLQPISSQKSEHEILSTTTATTQSTTTPSVNSVISSSNTSSSKHKKSKKSSKKVKEFTPDKHCGVVEGNKGPCLRSITCSNHMIHLRKAVRGRSKDLLQLIAEHKASKDKEPVKPTPQLVPKPEVSPSSNLPHNSSPSIQIASTTANISTPIATPVTTTSKSSSIHVITQPLRISVPNTGVSVITSQGSNEPISTSVVYMPMSPVAVVSPMQFVQFGGPILRVASTQPILSPPLATQPVVVTIPVVTGNGSQYSGHPKPLILSSCSSRKIGGAVVLQNQRVDRQRTEVQVASNMRRSITNSCSVTNTHHKPNILKTSVRSGHMNISVKRPAPEKLLNDNNKHIRMSDVNGFILHADVSEAAEAPQSNTSIHEKVTFVNMK